MIKYASVSTLAIGLILVTTAQSPSQQGLPPVLPTPNTEEHINQIEETLNDLENNISALELERDVILRANQQQIEQTQQTLNTITTFAEIIGAVLAFATLAAGGYAIFVGERSSKREITLQKQLTSGVERETQMADNINGVMAAVKSLLEFQDSIAKRIEEQRQIVDVFKPGFAVERTKSEAELLKKNVNRRNLYEQSGKIIELADRVKFIEYTFGYQALENEPWIQYLVGLAAIIENRMDDTERHLSKAVDLVRNAETKWPDPFTAPMCLYFWGILKKNQNQCDEAVKLFNEAIVMWPSPDYEARAFVERAEAIALATRYQAVGKARRIEEAFKQIESTSSTEEQKANLQRLQARLHLIEGNYEFTKGEWGKALDCYLEAMEKDQDNIFTMFSIAIAKLKMGEENWREDLKRSHDNILSHRKHMKHPERRGKILLIGTAIIAAQLCDNLSTPGELLIPLETEIQQLEMINAGSKEKFHIFSPLTKGMVDLDTFVKHVTKPKEALDEFTP